MRRERRVMKVVFVACDPESYSEDRVALSLYGPWGFGLPPGPVPNTTSAKAVRVTVMDVQDGSRRAQDLLRIDAAFGSERLENIPFGDDVMIHVEALNVVGAVVAYGASAPMAVPKSGGEQSRVIYMTEPGSLGPLKALFDGRDGPIVSDSPMGQPTMGHSMLELPGNRFLVIGGATLAVPGTGLTCERVQCPVELSNIKDVHDRLEFFDANTGYFESTSVRLSEPRVFHTAHLLPGNRILVVGGLTVDEDTLRPSATADIISFEDDGRPSVKPLLFPDGARGRFKHAGAVTASGAYIAAGGARFENGALVPLDEVLVLGANRENFAEPDGVLADPRWDLSATAVGEVVLFAGGTNGRDVFGTTEIAAAQQGVLESLPSMAVPRFGHRTLRLERADGRFIMVVGGFLENTNGQLVAGAFPTGSLEVLDIQNGRWVDELSTGGLLVARAHFAMLELLDGSVLVAGGLGAGDDNLEGLDSVELLTPKGLLIDYEARLLDARMSRGRYELSAVRLPHGAVVVSGGAIFEKVPNGGGGSGFGTHQFADYYNPGPPLALALP